MSRRRRRGLSPEERSLWNSVARTVIPLPERQAPPEAPRAEPPEPLPPPGKDRGRHAVPTAVPPRRSVLEAVDPRRERLVARGRIAIDAVLDLHGMRQEEADRAISAFISRSMGRGHRVLLVITGKGSTESEHGRGILRKRFLQGVEAGFFGPGIASVRPAHQRHGGSGAFYLFLRSSRKNGLERETVTKGSRTISKRPRG